VTVTDDTLVEEPEAELPEAAEPTAPEVEQVPDLRPPLQDLLRPAAASALVSLGAGFEIGGIFGSWFARLLGMAAAVAGAAFAVAAQRSRRRDSALLAFPGLAALVAVASLIGAPGGPPAVVSLVRSALRSGSLLTPPVPFDPGWRVVVILTTAMLGFAGAWFATALGKPRLGLALCLPVIGLTAITQPENGKLLAGAVPIALIIAALALLFGGDVRSARELGRAFELKRAARAAAVGLPLLGLVIALNWASFLFPHPVYNPVSTAQKPRLVSSNSNDVLFEVQTKTKFTGPWRTGVLDVYKAGTWLLPPQDNGRLVDISGDKRVPAARRDPTGDVTLVLHNLGDTPILPSLAGTESVTTTLHGLFVDTRTDIMRITNGRLPAGLSYTLHVPPYASTADLEAARPASAPDVVQQLAAPAPPPAVVDLLSKAPNTSPFARMQFVEHALLDHITAKGAGIPIAVSPARVQDMMAGSKVGSPFEIVAAEALIARWAGVPSRVGFGYDGVNQEQTGVVSVRPQNAADWLEVNFDGFGWLPLVAKPKQAQQDLTNTPKHPQQILANDEIAVQVFVPYKVVTAKQLYQIVRYWIAVLSPILLLLTACYFGWPIAARARRRSKRRRWAAELGPAHQIAVEYCELRDLTTDLNVGDLVATPLEFLFQVASDDEHADLAWLTVRALYGDLVDQVGPSDVAVAEELSRSVQRRLLKAQPLQSQYLARVSRASLRTPYEPAMPNVRLLRLPHPVAAGRRWLRGPLRATRLTVASLPLPRRRSA
jgi:hypothetical protein